MRKRYGILFALALAAAPGAARAVPIVELVWVATSGTGVAGGATIAAAPGDVLTGEIRVGGDTGISSYGLSLEFDLDLGDELDVGAVTELTPPGFAFSFTPGVALVQESNAFQRGRVLTFEAATLGVGPAAFVVGHVVFTVGAGVASDGPDLFLGLYHAGVDGLFDNDGQDLAALAEFRSAAVNAIPEAASAALVALGVLGLALGGRR